MCKGNRAYLFLQCLFDELQQIFDECGNFFGKKANKGEKDTLSIQQ